MTRAAAYPVQCCDHTCDESPARGTGCCDHSCGATETMQRIEVKRGDDLDLPCTALNPDGTPMDITGWTITAQLRAANGVPKGSFTVALTAPTLGQFTLSVARAVTATWTPGEMRMDIEYIDLAGKKTTSPTRGYIVVDVLEDWTY